MTAYSRARENAGGVILLLPEVSSGLLAHPQGSHLLFSLSVQIRTREREKTPEGKQLKHSPGFVPSVAHSQSSSGDFFIPQREEGFAPAGKMSSPPISRAAPPRGCWDLWRGLIRSDMAQNLQGIHLLAHSLCILSIRGMNCDNQSACACV